MSEYTLTPQGRKALVQSIADWEQIEVGELSIIGHDCPLCEIYATGFSTEQEVCLQCPVYAYTTARQCFNTPFYDAREAEIEDQPHKLFKHAHDVVVLLREILNYYK